MRFDEAELIEFFGVLPTEQNPEEQEFFGTTVFDIRQGNYHLSISHSIYYKDVHLHLNAIDLQEPLLDVQLQGVEEITVRRDKPSSEAVLIIYARGIDESKVQAGIMQNVQVMLEPRIKIKVRNRSE